MQLLVIGGNGFIGSHFVAAAVDGGHQVTVVGQTNPKPAFAHGHNFQYLGGGVDELLQHQSVLQQADVVLHSATSLTPSSVGESSLAHRPAAMQQITALLNAMEEVGPSRLVYLSSGGAVYGAPKDSPIPEQQALQPISVYGEIKRSVEESILQHAKRSALQPLIVRPANPYGPGQRTGAGFAVIPTFVNLVLSGQPVTLFGDGTSVRDYVHVADVARFLLMAVEGGRSGIFNLGSGQGTSLLDLLGMIEQATGEAALRDQQPARPYDPQSIVLDISRAREAIGWRPTIPLEQGIAQYVETMR